MQQRLFSNSRSSRRAMVWLLLRLYLLQLRASLQLRHSEEGRTEDRPTVLRSLRVDRCAW